MPRCPRRPGWGVAVDQDGRLLGGVQADDVLAALRGSSAGFRGRLDERRSRSEPTAMTYLLTHLDDAWTLTLIHLRLSLVPIVLGLLIAVPLGAIIQRTTAPRRIVTVIASIVFTIPSLALFVVLPLVIPTRILDEANVLVRADASTPPRCWCARGTQALDAVPADMLDAATAVGYRPRTGSSKWNCRGPSRC